MDVAIEPWSTAGAVTTPAGGDGGHPMPHFKYLIVGAGMTGDAAVSGIREVDPNGPIGLIGGEQDRPYDRPPLTKALWKGAPPGLGGRSGSPGGPEGAPARAVGSSCRDPVRPGPPAFRRGISCIIRLT